MALQMFGFGFVGVLLALGVQQNHTMAFYIQKNRPKAPETRKSHPVSK